MISFWIKTLVPPPTVHPSTSQWPALLTHSLHPDPEPKPRAALPQGQPPAEPVLHKLHPFQLLIPSLTQKPRGSNHRCPTGVPPASAVARGEKQFDTKFSSSVCSLRSHQEPATIPRNGHTLSKGMTTATRRTLDLLFRDLLQPRGDPNDPEATTTTWCSDRRGWVLPEPLVSSLWCQKQAAKTNLSSTDEFRPASCIFDLLGSIVVLIYTGDQERQRVANLARETCSLCTKKWGLKAKKTCKQVCLDD